jgi:hypothetical protein
LRLIHQDAKKCRKAWRPLYFATPEETEYASNTDYFGEPFFSEDDDDQVEEAGRELAMSFCRSSGPMIA